MPRRMLDAPVSGKRWRRQKIRWKDSCKRNMESVGLRGKTYWTGQSGRMIFATDPPTSDGGKRLAMVLLGYVMGQT